jgi:hypothetical protein
MHEYIHVCFVDIDLLCSTAAAAAAAAVARKHVQDKSLRPPLCVYIDQFPPCLPSVMDVHMQRTYARMCRTCSCANAGAIASNGANTCSYTHALTTNVRIHTPIYIYIYIRIRSYDPVTHLQVYVHASMSTANR